MSDSSKLDSRENSSEDLENLLSIPISKDYVNCVWTSEPTRERVQSNLDNSSEKLVIADVTSPIQQNNDATRTADQGVSCDQINSDDKCSSPKGMTKRETTENTAVHSEVSTVNNSNCSSSDSEVVKMRKMTEKPTPPLNSEASADISENKSLSPKIIRKRKKMSQPNDNDEEAVKKNAVQKRKDLPEEAKKSTHKPIVNHTSPSLLKSPVVKNSVISTGETIKEQKERAKTKSPRAKIQEIEEAVSEENVFADYKKLVKVRFIPPYKPKQIDTRFFAGNYFTCKACNDKYIVQTSLIRHLSRKTGNFMYNCPVCQTQVSFDNRCSLLIHIMSHDMNIDAMKPGDLAILPVSPEENECSALFKNTSCASSKCSECSSWVPSLQLHLKGEDFQDLISLNGNANSSLNCNECTYILPSKCALSAHERFHKGLAPHLCPECGELFLKSSSLVSHMEENCSHNLKKTLFLCTHCRVVLLSIDSFIEHLIEKHLHSVYSCNVCDAVVGSFEDLNAHRLAQHKLLEADSLSGTDACCTGVECDKCPGAIISLPSLRDHAQSHALDSKFMATIFQCKECKGMYASRDLLLSHKIVCQGKTEHVNTSVNEICFSELPADIANILQASARSDINQAEQNVQGPSPVRESLHSTEVQAEQIAGVPGQENVQVASFEGNNKPSSKLLRRILLKKNVTCKLCRLVVSETLDKVALKRHFLTQHVDIFMKAIHDGSNRKRPAQVVYRRSQKPKSRKKRGSVTKILKSLSNQPKSDASETDYSCKVMEMRKKTNGSKCYKCSFTSNNSETFRMHIITHRSNPTDLQCPKCGLCFIVRPPLEKHLIVDHGVKKVKNFLKDHGFEEHASEDENQSVNVEESDEEELQENQCKVCKETFESAMLLEKHFRIHGGAFLLAKLKAKRLNQTV